MEVSPASALHIEKSLSPRPWALMHSATSDQWANICAAPNAGKSSPSRCLLAAMHAYQYLMSFSQLNLWILVIYVFAPKILVVSQKALIRTSTTTFLRQNSQSSSIMIWKAGRLGDAADRIRYDSIYQVHISIYYIYIYLHTCIMVQYTFIYKHEHFTCIGRYRYIYYILVLLLTKKCPSTFGTWFKGMTSLCSITTITIFTKESPSAPSALRFARHSPEAPQSDAWERATSGNFENHMDITNIRTLWVQVGSD